METYTALGKTNMLLSRVGPGWMIRRNDSLGFHVHIDSENIPVSSTKAVTLRNECNDCQCRHQYYT